MDEEFSDLRASMQCEPRKREKISAVPAQVVCALGCRR